MLQARAAEAAVREVESAAGSGAKVAVFRLDVGLDAKALTEAWAACQKAHPELPVMFVSADTGVRNASPKPDNMHIRNAVAHVPTGMQSLASDVSESETAKIDVQLLTHTAVCVIGAGW